MREFLGIILLSLLVWLHYNYVTKTALKAYYFPALFLKFLAGIGVGVIYKYYYVGGDTWSYFNQSILLSEVGFSSFSNFVKLFVQNKFELITGFNYIHQPRAALMVKTVAIINVFTGSSYWVTTLFYSFFSFIGVYKFATWVSYKFKYGKMAALSLFVWPSFVFWSSGILKETVAVGLIFYIIPTFFEGVEAKSVKKALVVIIGLVLLFWIKYYFASVLIITLLLYAVSKAIYLQLKTINQQVLVWSLMMSVGFVVGGIMHYNLRLENIFGVIIENNTAFGEMSSSHSLIEFNVATQPWVWLIINTPKALFASLFMPLIPSSNVLFFLSSIENWVLLGLLVRGLFFLSRSEIQKNSVLLIACSTYILTMAVFLALSTPNLGTLSRYKVAFIPIVLVLVILANKFSYFGESK